MENWYEFTAYNSQALYGYGTADEAGAYCAILNRDREVNVYGYQTLNNESAARLDDGDDTDGFNLSDALATQAENDEWRAAEDERQSDYMQRETP